MPTITIPHRFRGPSTSGNGGYSAGALAAFIDGDALVTLRRPPPLDRELEVRTHEDGRVEAFDGDVLIAEAAPTSLTPPELPHVSLEEAHDAATRFPGLENHAFPECFVCGPARAEGDGLRIFNGPLRNDARWWAAPWTPAAGLGAAGTVDPVHVWAALDCPGGWAAADRAGTPVVLGRLAGHIVRDVPAGAAMIALGWERAPAEGRKHFSGSALLTPEGDLLAYGEAVWISLPAA